MTQRHSSVIWFILGSLNLVILPMACAEENAQSAVSVTAPTLTTTTQSAVSVTPSSASGAYTPQPSTLDNNITVANTRNQISQIVFNEDFSKKSQNKHWQRKHPPLDLPEIKTAESSLQDNSNFAQTVGLIIKIMALLGLLVGVLWIVKHAETWLAWFSGSKGRRTIAEPDTKIASHYRQAFAPIWQGLPEKSRLSQFVKEAVLRGDWLLALSTLYRGTLREIVDIYDLPITRATTERQSEWLLQKQNVSQSESDFFQQLIEIWAKVAYGQQRPNSQQVSSFSQAINQLAMTWDSLYLHRQSHLDKRYQQLGQSVSLPSLKKGNNA